MTSLFNEELKCPGCQNKYCTDTGDPRILKCGHSLCTDCLQYRDFQLPVQCLQCQGEVTYEYLGEIPVAFTLKAFIAKLHETESVVTRSATFNENIILPVPNEAQGESLASLGTCELHNSPIHFSCLSCEEWICGTCVCLKHSSNKKTCRVVFIHEALKTLKEEMVRDLTERSESAEGLKHETKMNITTTDELLGLVTQQISLDEKYQKEMESKRATFIEQEKRLNECDEITAELTNKLTINESTENLKETIGLFVNKKSVLNKKPEKNDLFSTWKHWIHKKHKLMDKSNDVHIRWTDWKGTNFLISLKYKSGDVIMSLAVENIHCRYIIFEPSFFCYSIMLNHAFIDLKRQSNSDKAARITFILDDTPLAQEFMKCCCYEGGYNYLKNAMASFPSSLCHTLVFGVKDYKYVHDIIFLEDTEQYTKPVANGIIGIYNNLENSNEIDVNKIQFYLHMVSGDSPPPPNLHYISYGEEPKLRYTLGFAYSGYECLDYMSNDDSMVKMFVQDCGVLADCISEDEEEND